MDAKIILNKKLSEIKPSLKEEEIITGFVSAFMPRLNKSLAKFNAKAVLGGSFSKGTTIKKDKYDVDIFVVFPKSAKDISHLLEKALKSLKIKAVRLPGSRDYFSIKVREYWAEFSMEIVPVVKIKKAEEALNVTDVSVLHVSYVKKKIAQSKKLSDEIRLAKAFCYAQGCYGAESHIRGFSGYCLEVLTAYYGSFINLAKATSKWGDRVVIDPEKHYKNKDEVLLEINEAKLISPIVLVDPVQKNRNVAAALDSAKFELFKKNCKAFVSSPAERFFERKRIDEEKIIINATKKRYELFKVTAVSDKVKEDISGAKLLKLHNLLKISLEKGGYSVNAEWDFKGNKSSSYLTLTKSPTKLIRKGPQVKMEQHAKAFRKKWKKVSVKNGWLFAEDKPKTAETILRLDKNILNEMSIDSYSVEELA